ncbi:hypothetical protein ACFFQF_03240 [Haladaptatus pallidirubidus]|uniref:hypothetical protein n=1 Tax=Haladaptatus pallidirubidus TaxID=1008152 RepID=UPI0035EC877F
MRERPKTRPSEVLEFFTDHGVLAHFPRVRSVTTNEWASDDRRKERRVFVSEANERREESASRANERLVRARL